MYTIHIFHSTSLFTSQGKHKNINITVLIKTVWITLYAPKHPNISFNIKSYISRNIKLKRSKNSIIFREICSNLFLFLFNFENKSEVWKKSENPKVGNRKTLLFLEF